MPDPALGTGDTAVNNDSLRAGMLLEKWITNGYKACQEVMRAIEERDYGEREGRRCGK